MRLQPRHYLLIAIVFALGIWNFVRVHRRSTAQIATSAVAVRVADPTGPPPQSPGWAAFDHAAQLRDAPPGTFSAAQQALAKAQAADPQDTHADLEGCGTWLMYYRQSVLHPSRDLDWRNRSAEHIDRCVKFHRDAAR